jgi:hypothetical protein
MNPLSLPMSRSFEAGDWVALAGYFPSLSHR